MTPLANAAALPSRCDVLVVGAGPAGSAAATQLARQGVDVLLVDQHAFPREKVCGDGLIPDAHQALRRLGVLDQVLAQAQPVSHVRCVGPGGGHVDVPGQLAVLPRRQLDHLLVGNAQAAGARLAAPVRFEQLLEEGQGGDAPVRGARLRCGDQTTDVLARWVVMATGAPTAPMTAAGLNTRRSPTGMALRAYVYHPGMREQLRHIEVVWHKALRPGYGWIFPCGGDVYNIGVGAFQGEGHTLTGPPTNLRQVFDAFTRFYEPARALLQGGTLQGGLKGAPLRCTLAGARYSRPGVLAVGEAIGSTYDFTGEGIGKAMETGLMAADALTDLAGLDRDAATVCADYERRLAELQPRFNLYQKANRINAHPWLADLVIWRAKKSRRLLQRMSGVLNETSNPGNLVTARGLLRLFTE